ncbi:MAG: hypothetical protein HUU38_06085 [Anaerolineales bacterium]|nr:hypothetical protein [Anaerolineales bacterium]
MPVIQNASPEEFIPHIHEAFRNWTTLGDIQDYFLEALLLAKGRIMPLDALNAEVLRLTTNQVLLNGLEELEKKDGLGGRILRERFLHGQTILEVAKKLGITEDHVNQRQRKAFAALAQILFVREKKIRQEVIEKHENNLPPKNYLQLFGLDAPQKLLVEKLLDPKDYAIVNLVGIGGIGKTALAQALTRAIIPEFYFERVIWLRIEPPTLSGISPTPELAYASFLTQLAQSLSLPGPVSNTLENQVKIVLRASPCLIIVDNLEGEADARLIWPNLQQWAGPSKFLVTSRTHPPKELDLYTFSVMELGREDAGNLIHHQANMLGVSSLTDGSASTIEDIYRATGGNPLAIKLVVSLARDLPLKKILGDFTRKKSGRVEAMYRKVYLKTWAVLPPDAQMILQAMPLASEAGAVPEQIQAMCGLEEDAFWEALQILISYSLIEVLGTPQTRRYGIHGLTRSFIQTDIIGWPYDTP